MKFRHSLSQRFEKIQKENRTFFNPTELQDRLERCRWRAEKPKLNEPPIPQGELQRN